VFFEHYLVSFASMLSFVRLRADVFDDGFVVARNDSRFNADESSAFGEVRLCAVSGRRHRPDNAQHCVERNTISL